MRIPDLDWKTFPRRKNYASENAIHHIAYTPFHTYEIYEYLKGDIDYPDGYCDVQLCGDDLYESYETLKQAKDSAQEQYNNIVRKIIDQCNK